MKAHSHLTAHAARPAGEHELRDLAPAVAAARSQDIDQSDAATIGYLTHSASGAIHRLNLAATRLLGVRPGAAVGQSFLPFVADADRESFLKHLARCRRGESPVQTELRLAVTGQPEVMVELISLTATAPAQPTVWQAVLRDLTVRKRIEEALRASEERYQIVADFTHDWESWISPDGRIKYVSPAVECITGRPVSPGMPAEELLRLVTHSDDLDRCLAHLRDDLAGLGRGDLEFRIVRPNGEVRWIHHLCQAIGNAPERFLGNRCSNRDITDRKLAEERIKAALAEEEVLLREIHHRVKNNLQVIASLISLQADSLGDDRLRAVFGDLRDRVRTMGLVHEKLYQTGNLARLDFADYTTSLLQYLWRALGVTVDRVRLNLELAPVPMPIDTALHCGLILNELVSNALKHAFPAGRSGEITVSLAHVPATGAVNLRVRDNGAGLPAGLDWQTTESLGLRLVHLLTGQLRGTVEIGTGIGTEFCINFSIKGQST